MKQTTAPFRIEKKEAFRVIGYTLHTTNQKKKQEQQFHHFGQSLKRTKNIPLYCHYPIKSHMVCLV